MANLNAPKGAVPLRYLNGAAWNGSTNLYYIPSSDGNQYNVGDFVATAAGGDANGVPIVTKTSASTPLRGVITGVAIAGYNNPSITGTNLDLTIQNIPATKLKGYYVFVCDDPNVLYEIQDDGLNALTSTACNKNALYTVANPTSPGQNSATVLTTSTIATTNTLPLKIMGLSQKPNNVFGANALWVVKINAHELIGPTTAY